MVESAVDPLWDVGGPGHVAGVGVAGAGAWVLATGAGVVRGGSGPGRREGGCALGCQCFPAPGFSACLGPHRTWCLLPQQGRSPEGMDTAGKPAGTLATMVTHCFTQRVAGEQGFQRPRKPSWGWKVGVCAPSSFPALGVWPIGSHLSRPSGRCLLLAGQGCSPGKPGFPRQTDRWVFPDDVLT